MTLPLTGTASVTSGSTTVVVSGFALSKLSVIPGTTVYLDKVPYFVLSLTDSETFELEEPYAGADNAAVPIKVNQLDAAKAATVALNSAIATYSARLALLEADGKGLFYTSLGVTGANDPGPGKLARDHADWAMATALYFDVLDAGGRPATGAIDLWAPETVLIVRSIETRAFARYRLTAAPTNEGPDQWRKLVGLDYIDGDGIIADGEDLAVEWNRAGIAGPILGIPLVFDSSGITDVNPGAGKVRANHLTNPTILYISKTNANGASIAARLATLGTSTNPVKALLRFQPSDGGTAFMDYDVTGLTDAAGYVKLAVVLRSGAVAANGQALTLNATPSPNKGTDGTITGVTTFWQGRILADTTATAARAGLGVDGGVGNYKDLRGSLLETGTPADVYGVGTVFGFARGGSDGLLIPGLGTNQYGVLQVDGQYSDITGSPGLQRTFTRPDGVWRQTASTGAAWGAWSRDGAWEKITSDTLTSVASWSRTDLGAFRKLRVTGWAKPATDAVAAMLRTDANNGASFDAGASDYVIGVDYHVTGAAISSASNAYNAIYLNWITQIGNGAAHGVWFDMLFDQFNQAERGVFIGRSAWIQSAGNLNSAPMIAGQRPDTTARNALQFVFTSGNIASGHILLEGIRS